MYSKSKVGEGGGALHARTLLPAALASVPFGFVLVRVRVLVHYAPSNPLIAWPRTQLKFCAEEHQSLLA